MRLIIYLLIVLLPFNAYSQNVTTQEVDIRYQSALSSIAYHFTAEALDRIEKKDSNFIKIYSFQFYIGNSLQRDKVRINGLPHLAINELLIDIAISVNDSVLRYPAMSKYFNSQLVYIPIIYISKPKAGQQAFANISEAELSCFMNFTAHGNTESYVDQNAYFLAPILYYYPGQISDWIKLKASDFSKPPPLPDF